MALPNRQRIRNTNRNDSPTLGQQLCPAMASSGNSLAQQRLRLVDELRFVDVRLLAYSAPLMLMRYL
ncbi:MAG: hypothetical protein K8963_10220 [Proteobacteria bacterium]|nr:hypothetical protein [Pseudomonadota bacterium]